MDEYAAALLDAIDRALPLWIERSMRRLSSTVDVDPTIVAVRADVIPRLRALLEADIDEQPTTPLAILRDAVRYPTEALRDAGVAEVDRDDFVRDRFPDDVYALTPASWVDVDESLVESGIAWGASKAWEHKRRHAAR